VSWQSTISVGGALYSVPSTLVDERVWARVDGGELIVIHADSSEGPREVARHALTTPGRPSIRDEHYPPRPAGALERRPRAQSADERAFLQIGPSAERWLVAAAAAGASRLRRKVAEAIALAKLHGNGDVDEALATAAAAGRFGDGDLAAILAHQGARVIEFPRPRVRRGLAAALHALLGGLRDMTTYYQSIRALIDPEQSDPLPDGGRLQDVSVILTDQPRGREALRPAAVALLPCQARELAFCLLELAEHADRMRPRR
jgi:hypothetical protein